MLHLTFSSLYLKKRIILHKRSERSFGIVFHNEWTAFENSLSNSGDGLPRRISKKAETRLTFALLKFNPKLDY